MENNILWKAIVYLKVSTANILHQIQPVNNGFTNSPTMNLIDVSKKTCAKIIWRCKIARLLNEDPCRSLKELSNELNVNTSVVGKNVCVMGMEQRKKWVANKLKERMWKKERDSPLIIFEI